MRKVFLFVLIMVHSICKTCAQIPQQQLEDPIKAIEPLLIHGSPSSTCSKHMGEQVYIEDTVTGYQLVNKRCELLFVGYPETNLIVVIKGKDVVDKSINMLKGVGTFSGKLVHYHKKPAIIITNIDQFSGRIRICQNKAWNGSYA